MSRRSGYGLAIALASTAAIVAWSCRSQNVEEPPGVHEESHPPPGRIASLAPHLTEMLLAIGTGDAEVVGAVDGTIPWPEGVSPTSLGPTTNPDVAALVALRPDLVVMAPDGAVEAFLAAHGIRHEVFATIDLLDPIRAIRRLGAAIDRDEEAGRIEDTMVRRLLGVKERLSAREPVPVAVAVGRQPALFVGSHPYLNAVIQYAGGMNVFASEGRPYASVDPATLPGHRVRVVLDATDALEGLPPDRREARWWEGAVDLQGHGMRLAFLESDSIFVPGPRMVEGIEDLARALHPDAFLAGK